MAAQTKAMYGWRRLVCYDWLRLAATRRDSPYTSPLSGRIRSSSITVSATGFLHGLAQTQAGRLWGPPGARSGASAQECWTPPVGNRASTWAVEQIEGGGADLVPCRRDTSDPGVIMPGAT